MDLADKLRKTKSLSQDESKKILQVLASKGIIGSLDITDNVQSVRLIENFDDLVSEIINRIDKAEKNIFLASFYNDSRAVEAILRAVERGLTLSILSGTKKSIGEKLQMLGLILNPSLLKLFYDFFEGKIRIKSSDFPFSFCVIDEKYVILELPNAVTSSFHLGFSFENEAVSKTFIETFEELFKKGKVYSPLNQFKKEAGMERQI